MCHVLQKDFQSTGGQVVDQAFQNEASRVVGIHTRSAESLGKSLLLMRFTGTQKFFRQAGTNTNYPTE